LDDQLLRLFDTLLDAREPERLLQLEDELELRWPGRCEAATLARLARRKRERLAAPD
jgi:hypothetical protein